MRDGFLIMSESSTYSSTSSRTHRIVLLDLDGTLTQSDAGIITCAKLALQELQQPIPDDAEMQRFIGPSILESFQRINVPENLQQQGLAIYRKYYSEIAAFDDPNIPGNKIPGCLLNRVYDGIPEQLIALRNAGFYLATASCKPEYQVKPICDYFGLTELIDGIYGASKDMTRITKAQVIRYVFDEIGYDPTQGDKALMVGDRWTDADGAKDCGLDCLGCAWGYAEPGELASHGAYRIIDNVTELSAAVHQYFA